MAEATSAAFSKTRTIVICIAVLFAGLLLSQVIFTTEPVAQIEAATKRTAMLVEVVEAEYGSFHPQITAMGTVVPAERVLLRAQVSGHISARAEHFFPGGYVRKGDMLVQIDPADYRHQLQQFESELVQAQSALAIEAGEQEAARRDYVRLNRELKGSQQELILRKPQMRSAQAKVSAAQAMVERAKLDLARTQVRAPFDAQVISRNVDVGSMANPNETLAEVVGVDHYWVEASLPLARLPWLVLPTESLPGGSVSVRNRTAWPSGASREGRLLSVVGSLDGSTRMARVIIKVEDPLALRDTNNGARSLVVGSFVECSITTRKLDEVVKIHRDYVRKNNTAWVMERNTLVIRELDIVFQDKEYAYLKSGLNAGDKIVTTDLSRVREGAELRLKGEMNSEVRS
ncbi:efflux RND transporter periplasmic adaptor subunit [Teredinibacter haidensis]|uniref:efflux RND transporter periplasmic adaptor subunit n=1 Tax=Teredinibacter haidensis TaxID=2731755 RepID=UPI000948A0AF|nr:efflux RND transporter periplasmic adaptor subunit [Teredinibacter haidensis]